MWWSLPVWVKYFKAVYVQYPDDAAVIEGTNLDCQLGVDTPHYPRKQALIGSLEQETDETQLDH